MKLHVVLYAALASALLTACPPPATGSVRVAISGHGLDAVTRVAVRVSGPGMSDLDQDLTLSGGLWQGTLSGIPEGADRVVQAWGYTTDPDNAAYGGQVTQVLIDGGGTTFVSLLLQELNPEPAHENAAPIIDGIAVGDDVLDPDQTVNLSVTAHDPNAGDTLTYAWSATAGSFADSSATATTFTAPSTLGPVTLTVTVSDADGAAATQSFTLWVRYTTGSIDLTVTFNHWPTVQSLSVNPTPVRPGSSTQVTAVASDADGEAVTYAWTATGCAGAFSRTDIANPLFTVDAAETAPATCALTVTTEDGRGGSGSGTVRFEVGEGAPITFGPDGPRLRSSWQSRTVVAQDQQATLRISADDTAGGDVTFAWSSNVGSLGVPSSTGTSSEVVWTAPACLSPGVTPYLRVTVTDVDSHAFTLGFPMSGPGECMTEAGGVSTGSVGSSGASLVSTSSNLTLNIPAGALDAPTAISVAVDDATPTPEGALSAFYVFGPDGTVFASPITVRLKIPPGVTGPVHLYWRRHSDDPNDPAVYDELGGVVEDGYLVAQVSHFSDAFIGPATGERTVSGSKVVSYYGSSHPLQNAPEDFSAGAPSALVRVDGGLEERFGTGASDGTFVIPGVPEGEYILRLGNTYVVTSNDAIDLGRTVYGRPDRELLESGVDSYPITFNVSGALPFQPSDIFELVSADVDNCAFDLFGGNWNPESGAWGGFVPDAGDTAFSFTIDLAQWWCGQFTGRPRAQDAIVLGQLVQHTTDAGTPVRVMQRIATLSGLDHDGGVDPVVTDAPLQDLSAQHSASYDVRGSQFLAHVVDAAGNPLPDVSPNHAMAQPRPEFNLPFVDVMGVGGTAAHGFIGPTLDLAYVEQEWTVGDYVTGGMDYGVPEGNWGNLTEVRYNFGVSYRLPCPAMADPGTCPLGYANNGNQVRYAGLGRTIDTVTLPSGTIVPTISPVRAARINGLPLSAQNQGLGTTPTLSWTAPAIGTPDMYTVTVTHLTTFLREFDDGNGGTFQEWWTGQQAVATLLTPHTSITLPSGILEAGEPYVFHISANQSGLPNPAQAPHRNASNSASAGILSDVQRP